MQLINKFICLKLFKTQLSFCQLCHNFIYPDLFEKKTFLFEGNQACVASSPGVPPLNIFAPTIQISNTVFANTFTRKYKINNLKGYACTQQLIASISMVTLTPPSIPNLLRCVHSLTWSASKCRFVFLLYVLLNSRLVFEHLILNLYFSRFNKSEKRPNLQR